MGRWLFGKAQEKREGKSGMMPANNGYVNGYQHAQGFNGTREVHLGFEEEKREKEMIEDEEEYGFVDEKRI